MTKKKAQNKHTAGFLRHLLEPARLGRFFARIFILDIPILLFLTALILFGEISWWQGALYFFCTLIATGIITLFVFKELENFISYLRSLALGQEVEAPRTHHGVFGFFRLADAFSSVKNLWSNQTLSDATILQGLPNPLIMLNETGIIVFANTVAKDFFGDDILYKPVKDIFSNDDFVTALNQIVSNTAKSTAVEFDYQDDETYTFVTRLERLPAMAKNNATMVMVMNDVSAFKRFRQQQSDFFANASHELKTPLSILSGLIETLQGPAKDDEIAQEKFLKMMATQTERMTNLVQDLLSLSRLQMMDKSTQTDVVLIPDLLKNVVESLTIKANAHNKKLSLKIVHDLPRFIGNRAELYHAVQNLIDNAIKYSEDNSIITIKASLNNGFPKKSQHYFDDVRQVIAIAVHNTGNPISAQNKTRIFERFYRLNSLKSRRTEGTGLGLGIVQQIVQKHDGLVDVVSSPSAGTTFTIYLPVDL